MAHNSLMSHLKSWKLVSRLTKAIMKSYHLRIPKYDFPIRLRPWFLAFTCFIMVSLGFLSFTEFSRALPLNAKALHFMCFCIATGVFYFIFDVEEDARRIWFWRHSGIIFTVFVCFFCGGILSEFVKSFLPYNEFQFGDVVANILGSSIGLYVSYHLERYYRRRREIARLYRPLDMDYISDDDEDEDPLAGTQLLPTHNSPIRPKGGNKGSRLADVWDEREELFGIGPYSDDEDNRPVTTPSRAADVPKIYVTPS